jgi:hypothetical protein
MLLITRFPVIAATVTNADEGPVFVGSDPLSITRINTRQGSSRTVFPVGGSSFVVCHRPGTRDGIIFAHRLTNEYLTTVTNNLRN